MPLDAGRRGAEPAGFDSRVSTGKLPVNKKKQALTRKTCFRKERQKGVEPSSPAWKAGVISRYTTAAFAVDVYTIYFGKKNVNSFLKKK